MRLPRVLHYQQQPRREGESELDELLRPFKEFFGRLTGNSDGGQGDNGGPRAPSRPRPGLPSGRIFAIIAGIIALIWIGSGIYIVNPGEVAIVRTWGAWRGDQITSGLHWRIPWPVQQTDILSIQRVQSMELGFRSEGEIGSGQGANAVASEARMITGDENLVDAQLVVQYRIRDAGAFLFNVKDPTGRPDGDTLRDATASALRQIVGQRVIDDVLTTGKDIVQVETQQLLQRLLDEYGTGIQVVNVQLQDVQPPDEVQAAFKDVISAREDRARFINEGSAYAEDIVPRARGEAERIVQSAEAFKVQRRLEATGNANRFLSRLREYREHPEATRIRLYLETMERILPGVKVVVVDEEIGSNALPFLPLDDGGSEG